MSYIDYKQFGRDQAPQNFSYALNMLLERLMADERITQSEMTVCLALAKCCHQGDGECFPKVKTVMNTAKVSERTFRSCLNSLEEKGYIIRNQRHRADGAQSSNIYKIPMMVVSRVTEVKTIPSKPDTNAACTPAKLAETPCNDCTPNKKDTFKKDSSLSSKRVSQQKNYGQEKKDGFSIIQRKAESIPSKPHGYQRVHEASEQQQTLSGQRRVELPSQSKSKEKRYLVDPRLLGITFGATSGTDATGLPVQAPKAADRQRELCGAHG